MNSNTKRAGGSGELRGIICTLLGGSMWGFSGTCGQYLMQTHGVVPNFLVPVRLLVAGFLLLLICYVRQGKSTFDVWKKDAVSVLIFGVIGMSMCQYTYYVTIEASNSGIATVLQYIAPAMIMLYLSVRHRKLPKGNEVIAVILAILGTFLLATHGSFDTLVISDRALFWGLLSAVVYVVYTVQPGELLRNYGSAPITGWGMFIGGVALIVLFRPWTIAPKIDAVVVGGMATIIVVGTISAFTLYMEGVRLLGAQKASLYASIEPVSATFFSVVWMHENFAFIDLLGFVCIISTIFILSLGKKN